MEDIIERLQLLKREIDQAKQQRSELVGSEKQILARMKDEFNIRSEKALEREKKKLAKEVEELEKKIKEDLAELEEKYEW